ncbi:hypothetical protein ANN_13449 [Periplaneta americana]|uniref:Uncharacterized protein n=1 Tax=Periplaneta americana TaxID=6978 RepID=A0ABQ8TL78_PERAM|nr:hypothetical protein ANN_13449 [Periplaneta americana]
MSPGSSTDSYPAFAHIGLRENSGKNLNQVTCPDRDSNPGHLVSRPDVLIVTPQFSHRQLACILIRSAETLAEEYSDANEQDKPLQTQPHCTEIETLPHILGFCQHGTLIRNTRHHAIRELIAKSLPSFYEVHQEVHCLAKDGSYRRVDIIAIDRKNDRAIIIDPTVCFETAVERPVAVHEEKKTIYDPTIQYFRDYYHIQGQIEVFGVLFGARGTIPKFSVECFESFGIPLNILKIITIDVYSVQILRSHLYT